MNRVFRGALFPILIVIVLAFFVSKLLSPTSSSAVVHNYSSLVNHDLPDGDVSSFTVDTSSNTINVTLNAANNHTRYSVGYEPGDPSTLSCTDSVHRHVVAVIRPAVRAPRGLCCRRDRTARLTHWRLFGSLAPRAASAQSKCSDEPKGRLCASRSFAPAMKF